MTMTSFPHGITSMGIPLPSAGRDISGSTYFVDNNSGSDSNDGSTWERAFKTFAKAVTISNLDIARGSDRWARRNTIYYCADTEKATIVAFPNKCDVVGCGSYDANGRAGITGHHAPVNAGNYGTRFFNMHFKATATASPLVTLASTSSGIEFYNCVFDGVVGTVTTGITSTAAPFLRVQNCEFWGAFATAAISIGTGANIRMEILGNRITQAAIGITVNASATFACDAIIDGNIIHAAGITIDDNSDKCIVTNNGLISDASVTTVATCAEASDINAALACGNYLTAANVANILWPTVDTTT